jgi:flagellar motor switch protein FliN/FliY
VVELDRIAGDAVDIFVNDHMIAKGEVVVVDDKFGVRITELVSPMRERVEAVL